MGSPRQLPKLPTWALDDDEPGISLRRYRHYRLRWLAITILACAVSFVLGGMAYGAYQTPYDTIPGFGDNPTIRAIASGLWDAPSTWDAGRIPHKDDIVSVQQAQVTCASPSCIAHTIAIENGGRLDLEPGNDTHLATGILLVGPRGTLSIDAPDFQHVVTITIRDIPIDLVRDPHQYGTGILVVDGILRLQGTPKTAFLRLESEPRAGDASLLMAHVPQGWQPGDILILPDSRQWTDNTVRGPYFWEQPILATISGQKAVLQTALKHHHPGARDSLTQQVDFLPHVGNLSRNIVIRSENPQGTRGHILATRKSTVDIQYVRFQDLGRTTILPLDPMTNHIGRYPVHMHHLVGPQAPIEGHQFVLRGNVVHGGDTDHRFKWAVVVHDSHYGLIERNVIYNCAGGCFVTEDGSEYRNIFQDNFVVRAGGDGNRMGEGTEATGYWFRGGQNVVRRNVAASIPAQGPGVQHCGYSVWQQYTGRVRIPNFPGADTAIDGQYRVINLYEEPLAEFADNEVYSSACGVTMWWVGSEFTTPRATQESVVSGLRTWNIYGYGWIHYHTHKLRITGWKARGTPNVRSCCQAQYYGADYFMSDWSLKDSDLQGMEHGISLSTDTLGIQTIRNTRLAVAGDGIQMHTLWTSSHTPNGLRPRRVLADGVLVNRIPGSDFRTIRMAYRDTPVRTLIRPDELLVTNYQQSGQDFQAFYQQQSPGFIIPQTVLNQDGTPNIEGAPTAGLTNTQAWAQHNIAIAGAIAPCSDTRPEIAGIVCGIAVQPPIDTEPPTPPGSLTHIPSATSIILAWQASQDNVAVTAYSIARNGTPIATTSAAATSYHDTGLMPSTTYTYTVQAQDAAGNTSAPAQTIAATLPQPPQAWTPDPGYLGMWVLPDKTFLQCTASGDSAQSILQAINNGITQ